MNRINNQRVRFKLEKDNWEPLERNPNITGHDRHSIS